jgi:hypothetical protein
MNYKPVSQIHNALLYSRSLILSSQVRLLSIMKLDKSAEGTNVTPKRKGNYQYKSRSENNSTSNFTLPILSINGA